MCLYEGAKTSIKVDIDLSDESVVKLGMDQGSVPSLFLLVVAVDVITGLARGCVK